MNRRPGPVVMIAGGVLAVGLAVLVLKWLLITVALLIVPFGVWWVVDRSWSRNAAPALAGAVPRMEPITPVPFVPTPRADLTSGPVPALRPARRSARHSRPEHATEVTTPSTKVDALAGPSSAAPATAPVLTPASVTRRAPVASVPEPGERTLVRPFLPPDRAVTVTREEHHQGTLARLHRDRPVTRVTAELRASVVTAGKHQGSYALEVRVDGERVGELTAAMSTRYRRLVDTTPQGSASCLGTIAYGERGYQIELRLPKIS